jgi:periplasmic protein TonB
VGYPCTLTLHSLSSPPMYLSPRHTLVKALVFSLLVHAVLLLGVVRLLPVRVDVPTTAISAVVSRDRRGGLVETARVPDVKPLPEPVRSSSPVARKVPARQIAVARPSTATPVVPLAQPVERDVGRAAPASSGIAVGASAAPTASHPPVQARDGVSADDVRQYRFSLSAAAGRFKRYPAVARERGWEGVVEVAIDWNTLLPVPQVVLVRSSGRTILDEQALEMMTQAARATTLPEGLRGRDFRILLPVKYSLESDQ